MIFEKNTIIKNENVAVLLHHKQDKVGVKFNEKLFFFPLKSIFILNKKVLFNVLK